jgi:hypothetical protein
MSESDTSTHRIDDELRTHVARAFDFDEPPETFEAFWAKMMRTFADALGRSVAVEDLCTTDDSPHWATVNGETRYYQCVTDAFLLGTSLDEAVTTRTVSPVSGTELVVEFDEDGVVSAPEGAVLSFGVERAVDVPDGPVTPETMYGRFCPYSKAFASRDEYDQWAAATPGVVADVHPLDESLDLQARLLGDADLLDTSRSRGASDEGCSC